MIRIVVDTGVVVSAALYRFTEYLIAVFELPNTSYTNCKRGAQLVHFGRSFFADAVRAGTKRPDPAVIA